jgi:hypothetical protein
MESFTHNSENIKKILFHSNSILATLVTQQQLAIPYAYNRAILQYWDIQTSQLITRTILADFVDDFFYDLSFSPNKTKAIIIFGETCKILPVPLEVIYKNITKETFLYLFFLLKNYTSQCDGIEMPQDVNLLIAQILLETHKRQ